MLHRSCYAAIAVVGLFASPSPAPAQIAVSPTLPRELAVRVDPIANLEEQLINRLRATRTGQREYLKTIVNLVDAKTLDFGLVVAVERYALRRNPRYPFPFFERALNFEARKRNITLPSIQHFQTAASPIVRF